MPPFPGHLGKRLLHKDKKLLQMEAGNMTCPNSVAFWAQSKKYQVLRGWTSRSHQCLSLSPPWDPALCGFSYQARQSEQKLPVKPLPLELLLLLDFTYNQVLQAVLCLQLWWHQATSRIYLLACPLSCCRVWPQGLLGILASGLGLMRGKQ